MDVHEVWDENAEAKGRPTIAQLLRMEAEAHDKADITLMSGDKKKEGTGCQATTPCKN